MRIGVIRSDVKKVYLADVENTSQRNFSSEPAGQSRNLAKPTDAQIESVLKKVGAVAVLGSNNSGTVDTSTNNTLRIRRASTSAYTVITVPAGASTTKDAIAASLAQSLASAGLGATATISGTNQIVIYSTGDNQGPEARLQIDTVANGSTLSTALGFNTSGVTLAGLSVGTLKTAVYPTASTVDVSTSTISGLSSLNSLPASVKAASVAAIADLVAPRFVETSKTKKSAASGMIYKMTQSTFRPGKGHTGLPAGICVVLLQDDGVTPWTP